MMPAVLVATHIFSLTSTQEFFNSFRTIAFAWNGFYRLDASSIGGATCPPPAGGKRCRNDCGPLSQPFSTALCR
jgi:hypothetical protein